MTTTPSLQFWLSAAIAIGDVGGVKAALRQGGVITDKVFQNALLALGDNSELIALLLDNGATVTRIPSKSILDVAIAAPETLHCLLTRGLKLDAKTAATLPSLLGRDDGPLSSRAVALLLAHPDAMDCHDLYRFAASVMRSTRPDLGSSREFLKLTAHLAKCSATMQMP